MINSKSYKKLENHFSQTNQTKITDLFQDEKRVNDFTFSLNEITVDVSKNIFSKETLDIFLELADELKIKDKISAMFKGDKINFTEDRAVLHSALRNKNLKKLMLDGKDYLPEVQAMKRKFDTFVTGVREGAITGSSGKHFESVVNIGIGGSYLGTQMAYNALKDTSNNNLKVYFLSNIDASNLMDILEEINPETTLFVVASKTFTTLETLTNAATIKEWFINTMGKEALARHFVALSTNLSEVKKFGISEEWTFGFWDFIGGRYSIWSSIALPLALKIGAKEFNKFLEGAFEADKHLQKTDLKDNIPFILAVIGIWYNNFFNYNSYAILAYDYRLRDFTRYIQQLEMESNGKSINSESKKIHYKTSPVVFGEPGTDSQHSFFQMIHQGTTVIPCDFIGVINPNHEYTHHQNYLIANLFAQSEALMQGKTLDEVKVEMNEQHLPQELIEKIAPHKTFEGNRPSNVFLMNKLNAKNLGTLCALYEHKILIQGLLWEINSFDQWGVELGKKLATNIYNDITKQTKNSNNPSTINLLNIYKSSNDLTD